MIRFQRIMVVKEKKPNKQPQQNLTSFWQKEKNLTEAQVSFLGLDPTDISCALQLDRPMRGQDIWSRDQLTLCAPRRHLWQVHTQTLATQLFTHDIFITCVEYTTVI